MLPKTILVVAHSGKKWKWITIKKKQKTQKINIKTK